MKKTLQPSILIVEDDDAISSVIVYTLKKEGFSVELVKDGGEACQVAKQTKPDLILLDWVLPSMSGIEICKALRKNEDTANIPIIMISNKKEEIDKITGLDRGADDYITKPVSPAEIVARIRAILRRIRPAFSGKVLEFDNIKMDLLAHNVVRGDKEITLSPIEYKILQILMENPGRVLSRDALMDKIWGNEIYVGSRTVDVHITRLRKALLAASYNGSDVIKTIRLAGYTLRKD